MIYEKDINYIPEVKSTYNTWKKLLPEKKRRLKERYPNDPGLNRMYEHIEIQKILARDISVDRNFFYVLLNIDNTVYVFDKKSGKLVKKLILKSPEEFDSKQVLIMDASSEKYIYGINFEANIILKYEK